MGRRHSVERLPAEVRELIGRLRRDGRTIYEILDKLKELDLDPGELPSKSALGRWTKQLDAIAGEVNRNRHIAEALVERFGDKPDNRAARMNIELMHALITRLMFGEDGDMVSLTPQESHFLGSALKNLASAQKLDADRTLKLQQETAKRAAAAATGAARKAGISQEAIAAIERDVLGIA